MCTHVHVYMYTCTTGVSGTGIFNVPTSIFLAFFFNRRRANRRMSNLHAATLGWTMLGGSIHCTVHKTDPLRNQNNTLQTKKVYSCFHPPIKKPTTKTKQNTQVNTKTQNLCSTSSAKRPPYHSRGRCRFCTPLAAPAHWRVGVLLSPTRGNF